MPRKFAVLVAATLAVALTFSLTAFSVADDESPLEKQMSTINAKTKAIKNATKTPAAWKKEGKGVVKNAEEISRLGKEARKEKGPAEQQKKTYDEWTKLMDDMIKASDELASLASQSSTPQPDAKAAFNKLNKSCSDCHAVFRVDEEK
jgi:cytochrome c556